jgi:hypothetical protein
MQRQILWAFGFVIATVVFSRILTERAIRSLSTAERQRLFDSFSRMRMWNMLPLLVLLLMLLVVEQIFPSSADVLYPLFLGLIVVFLIAVYGLVLHKLRALQLPRTFEKRFLAARAVSVLGFLGFIVFLLVHESMT